MAIGLPEAVRVFTAFTGPDSDPGATPVLAGTAVIDAGTPSAWVAVTFTGAPTIIRELPGYGTVAFYRVMACWSDGANHIEILLHPDHIVVDKVNAGVHERIGTHHNFPYSWSSHPGTYYIQVSRARGQVFVTKEGRYQIAVGPIYGEGAYPADRHFPAGTHVVADTGSTSGTTAIDAYLGYIDQAGYDDGWRPYATNEDDESDISGYMLDHTYLPWVIDGGHLRDCFAGDYDQSFGGGGLLIDGQSSFGRLDVDVYGEHAKSGYTWYVVAGSMTGSGGSWSGVSALVVSPVGYAHMTYYGYQPGEGPADVPVFADGDTFSAIVTGQATTDFSSRHLQLLHNGVVYWETDLLLNTEGHDDGTYVGVWAQNYGSQPRGYGGPSDEWGVNNFRWTSLPVIPTPELPTAVLHVTPSSGLVPLTVLIDPGDSTNVSHSQLSGPGFATRFNTLDPFSVTYSAAGVEHLTLEVTDVYGRAASTSADVTVTVPPPPPPPEVSGWTVGRVR